MPPPPKQRPSSPKVRPTKTAKIGPPEKPSKEAEPPDEAMKPFDADPSIDEDAEMLALSQREGDEEKLVEADPTE